MELLKKTLETLFLYELNLHSLLSQALINLIVIAVWVVIGIFAVRISHKIMSKFFIKAKGEKRGKTLSELTSSALKALVWFIIILAILDELGFEIAPILASAGILGLAIGFGAQSLVKDIVSGFFIIIDNAFNIGETIEVKGFRGKVAYMNLRVTHLENFVGSVFIINNGEISQLINWSRRNTTAIVDFGVDYATDLAKVSSVMPAFMETLKEKYEEIVELPSFLGVTDLADSSINMRIIAKTSTGNHFAIERKIRQDLVEFLTKHKVSIPFPQIVIHQASKAQE